MKSIKTMTIALMLLANTTFAGVIGDALNSITPKQNYQYTPAGTWPIKGESVVQQLSKQYSVTGHQFTAAELAKFIDKGNDGLAKSGCLFGNSRLTTGMQAFLDKAVCEGAVKSLGIGGNFDCTSCSGEWSYQGSYFRSSRGQLIGVVNKTEDGYVIEFTESMMIVSHPSLGYRMVYNIANLKFDSPDYEKYNQHWKLNRIDTSQKAETQLKSQSKELYQNARFAVVEVTTPATINQISTYLKEQGNSVSINATYQIIDDIWQRQATDGLRNAIDFSKVVISQPSTTEKMIKAYFRK
ncbi:hypothetical protein [Geobacter sp.]|uniref:hypothetical protein n=1 Tax=Geobacter sp. TaxID=46610 RepID=UPI0027BAFC7C|nr:hypothetical protein [Geobacter sp.]